MLGSYDCKLISADSIGEEITYENGTKIRTEALQLLHRNLGDLIMHPTNYFKNLDLIDFTYPILYQSLNVFHSLDNLNLVHSDINLLDMIALDYRFFICHFVMVISLHIFLRIILQNYYLKFLTIFVKFKIINLSKNLTYFLKKRFGAKITKLQIIVATIMIFQCFCITIFLR